MASRSQTPNLRHIAAAMKLLTLVMAATAASLTLKPGRGAAKVNCPSGSRFKHIVAFGDSTTDTGNAVRSRQAGLYSEAMQPPYGGGYFGGPTGRFSDGRLIIDLLAESLGHSFVPPYMQFFLQQQNYSSHHHRYHGRPKFSSQNFAFAGASALDATSLLRHARNATSTTPFSLDIQINAFLAYVNNETRHVADIDSTLVYVGEIGGNDYNYYYGRLLPNPDPARVLKLVPVVVGHIERQLDRLVSSVPFVRHVIVQGQFPMGCLSLYIQKMDTNIYPLDSHGCVRAANLVTSAHDRLLRRALLRLTRKHRHVRFVFFDSAAAVFHVMDHAAGYGFTDTVNPCFGSELEALANNGQAPNKTSPPPPSPPATFTPPASPPAEIPAKLAGSCPDPSVYISWDGVHFTEAMHRALMAQFLYGGEEYARAYPNGNFLTPCV